MESNDSPEIPDRGETSDIPGLPSGGIWKRIGVRGTTFKTTLCSQLPYKSMTQIMVTVTVMLMSKMAKRSVYM